MTAKNGIGQIIEFVFCELEEERETKENMHQEFCLSTG
jgi:hypothetical protein